jgi:hypothetical protein
MILVFRDKRLVCNMNKVPDIDTPCPKLDRPIHSAKKPNVELPLKMP